VVISDDAKVKYVNVNSQSNTWWCCGNLYSLHDKSAVSEYIAIGPFLFKGTNSDHYSGN
jgi:hypothetical protein